MSDYTAISFAPVQGFIEKSRKLRDLFGASLILSYLSYILVRKAEEKFGAENIISPGLINHQQGMPNRILLKGSWERKDVEKEFLAAWQTVLDECRDWIEKSLKFNEDEKNCWNQEWMRWSQYTWEIFWGHGSSPIKAMKDLETRKLRRNWTGINWTGESSSLTGTDAIAWNRLGKEHREPGRVLNDEEEQELKQFYLRLAWLLDERSRLGKEFPTDEQLRKHFESEDNGKFLAPNERLSIPELVKRLVTYDPIADEIHITKLKENRNDPEFRDIRREAGDWTGWFIGDGDKVGDKIKYISERNEDNELKRDLELKRFTHLLRDWGKNFQKNPNLFPQGKGRVIYAGGDDFLGVLYSEEPQSQPIKALEAWNWLFTLQSYWEDLKTNIKGELDLNFSYSVGFVWAGHAVPQRDVLQHCREAEKRSKNLGRDRLTIRVVFNNGQYVQWTCPWQYLHVLKNYRDRDGRTWGDKNLNWAHIYNDWEHLKIRHAVCSRVTSESANIEIALAIFDLYFGDHQSRTDRLKMINGKRFQEESKFCKCITGNDYSAEAIVEWIDGLVKIGWQLCSNS